MKQIDCGKERILAERKRLSSAKSRYKKIKTDNQAVFDKGNLKPSEGMRLNMIEASAYNNMKYHEEALHKLIEELKRAEAEHE